MSVRAATRHQTRLKTRRCWLALLLIGGGLLLAGPRTLADGEPAEVKVQTLVRSGQAWNGTQLPAYPSGEPEVTVLHITIPPGVRLPMHIHPVINAGMLIRGQLLVISEAGAKVQLKAGDGLIEMVNQPHYGTNNGKEAAEIVVVYAGVKGKPITVLEPAAKASPKPRLTAP
ncbi:cupin domain-containing protein [Synechococcus sp. CCY9202]|jgi:quercetin dioxygenase-like cupin family protein|uniref:cupin domain-containing protein n=1 Tax=Synechococcus sp. CCY9202 TaxID=174698 RepID=UPI002B220244|nr:cupin domain-containing protein [Synechococcus sp. CCY9202]MEA5423458.1 cupin domain-containing protein [Synechococcus sp. CCY9202]